MIRKRDFESVNTVVLLKSMRDLRAFSSLVIVIAIRSGGYFRVQLMAFWPIQMKVRYGRDVMILNVG